MVTPGRSFSAGTQYRYGFNGQEKSTEIGEGLTTAEFWEYDGRIGRRWNVDPLDREYESPYSTFSDDPINLIDPNGAKPKKKDGEKNYLSSSTINKSIEALNILDKGLKNLQNYFNEAGPALEKEKKDLDLYVVWNLVNGFNYVADIADGLGYFSGNTSDWLASTYANHLTEYENNVKTYNSFLQNYNELSQTLGKSLKKGGGIDFGDGVKLDKLSSGGASVAALALAGGKHLNSNSAVGDFILYEIKIDGETWKYGIADANRLTAGNEAVRMSQQVEKLKRLFPGLNVVGTQVGETMLQVTKAYAKEVETTHILTMANKLKWIPDGNPAHWKQAMEFARRGLHVESIKLMQKFGKFLL